MVLCLHFLWEKLL
jgi:hypothetical protein